MASSTASRIRSEALLSLPFLKATPHSHSHVLDPHGVAFNPRYLPRVPLHGSRRRAREALVRLGRAASRAVAVLPRADQDPQRGAEPGRLQDRHDRAAVLHRVPDPAAVPDRLRPRGHRRRSWSGCHRLQGRRRGLRHGAPRQLRHVCRVHCARPAVCGQETRAVEFNEAAGIPLVSLTSYQALVQYGNVKAGSRVLILGGSSGTDIVAVQIAHALGAHVIATTSARNAESVKSLGADETIDYTSQKWADILAEHSLDAIYDCGMEPEFWNEGAQRVLKTENAHFVTIGGVANPIESPIGATYHQIMTKPSGEDLKEVSKFVAKGELSAHVDSAFAFEGLFEAIRKLKTNRARGKIALEIVPEHRE